MTTATTVLGLAPMSLGLGEGGELQAALGRVVSGGLIASTLITLLVIPMIYYSLERWSEAPGRAGSSASDAVSGAATAGD